MIRTSFLKGMLLSGLGLMQAACSSSQVCADHSVYADARPAQRMQLPEGMSVVRPDGSATVPGVSSGWEPAPSQGCVSAPPDPYEQPGYVAATSAGPIAASGAAAPAAPGPLVAQDDEAASRLGSTDAVLVTVYTWANAWAAGDIQRFRGLYAASFEPPEGMSREDYAAFIEERVRVVGARDVAVRTPSVRFEAPDRAVARFQVTDRRAGEAPRDLQVEMVLVEEGEGWQIQRESVTPL